MGKRIPWCSKRNKKAVPFQPSMKATHLLLGGTAILILLAFAIIAFHGIAWNLSENLSTSCSPLLILEQNTGKSVNSPQEAATELSSFPNTTISATSLNQADPQLVNGSPLFPYGSFAISSDGRIWNVHNCE